MVKIICLSIFSFSACLAQDDYSSRLAKRLTEIKKSAEYDNDVVVYNDTTNIPGGFEIWNPTVEYIQYDRVQFKGKDYEAKQTSRGKKPVDSPHDWAQFQDYHPYRFLRDTAKTEDLIRLASPGNHPQVKTYAIGALSFRRDRNLYQLIVNNLSDTCILRGRMSCTGFEAYAVDLMLGYAIKKFSPIEKEDIKTRIIMEYSHLESLNMALRYHNPSAEVYPQIRKIYKAGAVTPFALVALAMYNRPEDISLIREGFRELDDIEQTRNGGLFYKAIENFPTPELFKDLKEHRKKWDMNMFLWDHGYYYINAVAAYQNSECLAILEDLVSQKIGSVKHHHDIYYENQAYIFQALERYYCPMYDDLLKKIKRTVPKDFDLRSGWYNPYKNQWN
jgi:hypothetical protein